MSKKSLYSKRAHSSVGQSGGLIIRWSEVRVLLGPPMFFKEDKFRIGEAEIPVSRANIFLFDCDNKKGVRIKVHFIEVHFFIFEENPLDLKRRIYCNTF